MCRRRNGNESICGSNANSDKTEKIYRRYSGLFHIIIYSTILSCLTSSTTKVLRMTTMYYWVFICMLVLISHTVIGIEQKKHTVERRRTQEERIDQHELIKKYLDMTPVHDWFDSFHFPVTRHALKTSACKTVQAFENFLFLVDNHSRFEL